MLQEKKEGFRAVIWIISSCLGAEEVLEKMRDTVCYLTITLLMLYTNVQVRKAKNIIFLILAFFPFSEQCEIVLEEEGLRIVF